MIHTSKNIWYPVIHDSVMVDVNPAKHIWVRVANHNAVMQHVHAAEDVCLSAH